MNTMKRLFLLLFTIIPLVSFAQMDYHKTLKVGETLHCSINPAWVGYNRQSTEFDVSGDAIREVGPRTQSGTTIKAVKPGYGYVFITIYLKNLKTGATKTEYASWDITVIDNKPTSISVSPSLSSLFVGEFVSLSPVFYPSGTESAVTWSSNNNSVATVSSSGWVNAVGVGTAKISAQTDNGLTGSATIYVSQQATSVTLPQTTTVDYHSYLQLSPTFSPEGATVKSMSWNSSDNSVVTVYSDGLLYGVEPGQASVSVTTSNGLMASTVVIVKQPPFVVSCTSDGATGVSVINQSSIYAEISPHSTKGSQFDNVCFLSPDGLKVDGEPVLSGSQVSFVPKKPLKPHTQYMFVIPKSALCNQWGSENIVDYKFMFVTGDLEPMELSCRPDRDYIEQGSTVKLYASNPAAVIYYTLDGSEPTEKSTLLTGPITITNDVKLRGLAVLEGYQRAFFSKTIKVSHVSAVSAYPCSTDNLFNSHDVIPCVTFTHSLYPKNLGKVYFYKGTSEIPFQTYIFGNRIYFVPDEPLTEGCYDIYIPDDYAQASNGEPTSEVMWEFSIGNYITSISAGYEHVLALKASGELWGWGRGLHTDYTVPNVKDSLFWEPVDFDYIPLKAVAAGLTHSIFLTEKGEVYSWGLQYCGELGRYSYSPYDSPAYVGQLSKKSIAAGAQTTALIASNGDLTMVGRNDFGQQGNHDTSPVQYASDPKCLNIKQVALGYGTTLALSYSGALYGWGHNNMQQLTSNNKGNQLDVVYLMDNVEYVAASKWDDFAAAVIKKDNSLWMWGSGSYGRLGGANNLPIESAVQLMENVKSVCVGTHVVAAIKTDNSLWMWGDGSFGELGEGIQTTVLKPQKVMDDVQSVEIGGYYVVVLKTDGSVWSWGTGKNGELGWGKNTPTNYVGVQPHQIFPCRHREDLKALQLDIQELSLSIGEEFLIGARPVPLEADYQQWQWSVQNSNIASVSDRGLIKTMREGITDVILTSDGGIMASCKLIVTNEPDGVRTVETNTVPSEKEYYSLDGRRTNYSHKGIVIVRDGKTTRKMVLK